MPGYDPKTANLQGIFKKFRPNAPKLGVSVSEA